jgi:VCBS repeat-containing protein
VSATASAGASVSAELNAALANIASAFIISGGGVSSPSPTSTSTAPVVNTVSWAFAIDNALTQYLGAGQTVSAVYRITVTDNSGFTSASGTNEANTSSQDVTITISGANDGPVMSVQTGNSDSGSRTETNAGLSSTGTLTVRDIDLTNNVTVAVHSVSASGVLNGLVPTNAQLMAMLSLNPAAATAVLSNTETVDQLSWSFDSGNDGFNYLAIGEVLTLDYTLRATDSGGATFDKKIGFTITGTNDAPILLTGSGDTIQLSTGTATPTMRVAIPATGVVAGDKIRLSYLGQTQTPVSISSTDISNGYLDIQLTIALQDPNSNLTSVPVKWMDWTAKNDTNKTVSGAILTESGSVNATLDTGTGWGFVQLTGGTNFFASDSGKPYISEGVSGPTTSDIIAFNPAGWRTLTFSSEVRNLYFAFVSMNGNGYRFDRDFDIISQTNWDNPDTSYTEPGGRGYWGIGLVQKFEVLINGKTYYELRCINGEPHGVIRFKGAFTTLTWENPVSEYWHGFTVGIKTATQDLQNVRGEFLNGSTNALITTTPTTLISYDPSLASVVGTLRWSGFPGQPLSLTSEAGHHP